MQELSFIEERDEALFVAYKNALRQPDVKSHQQAIEIAINSPTSRFWISPYQGYREILWAKKHSRTSPMRERRNDMIRDLYAKYERLSNSPIFRGCSVFFVSQFAVAQPAPSFYLSYLTALRIIRRKRAERRAHV